MLPQHILVSLDGSVQAHGVLQYATTLTAALQARLTLLHVVEASARLGWEGRPELESVLASGINQRKANMRRRLAVTAQRICTTGVACEAVVVAGDPVSIMIHFARAQEVGLIIVGSHKRTGLAHVLLGSVAEKVVRLAPCAVLVVHGNGEPPMDQMVTAEAWDVEQG